MPVFNITSKKSLVPTITNDSQTIYSSNIVNSNIGNITFISEDLSDQINETCTCYMTSYKFVNLSLEIFLNGLRLISGSDFLEANSLDSFTFIDYDGFSRRLGKNSNIFVKYIMS